MTTMGGQVMEMELWLTDKETEHFKMQYRVKEVLYRDRSPFQEIAVIDTAEFGRALFLEGVIQTAVRDEFIYHEMLVHVPLTIHPNPERILVVGGGDGGTVREAVKHPEVKRVKMVEIDEQVVKVSRQFLPELACKLDDPKVELHIADAIQYVKHVDEPYDVVLVDSSDPFGPAVGIFTEEFYGNVAKALKDDGLMVTQCETPFYTPQLTRDVYRAIRRHFPWVRLYTASVPAYSTAPWGFMLASRRELENPWPRRELGFPTRYYSPEIHKAAFALPPFIRELLDEGEGR